MKSIILFVSILLCWCQLTFALPRATIAKIHQAVEKYYQPKEDSTLLFAIQPTSPPICRDPKAPSCLDAVCEKLGTVGCDSLDEVKAVGVACRGNIDGDCVSFACGKLGNFGCDSLDEASKVARACVGNYDISCVDHVCKRLGTFGCDSNEEITEVLKSCAGN